MASSRLREQTRQHVIAAQQRADTVEMERDTAHAECAELRRRLADATAYWEAEFASLRGELDRALRFGDTA